MAAIGMALANPWTCNGQLLQPSSPLKQLISYGRQRQLQEFQSAATRAGASMMQHYALVVCGAGLHAKPPAATCLHSRRRHSGGQHLGQREAVVARPSDFITFWANTRGASEIMER